ncbi:hypothetical protein O4328_28425 [Rhodococcus opacus]|uniref:Uncharacterized protein n=1 Tax=Rhodococcus opacus TaxID=37919 RepID=A0AAX3YPI2_RHOOP|nr:hypothetical protein [Rhodococcus opacus]MCZ4587566.1 hypothetical protein [Rhodococcus opacus]WLF51432.1 hypothetical protein Q5707_37830 [Rhodococcus opacus]
MTALSGRNRHSTATNIDDAPTDPRGWPAPDEQGEALEESARASRKTNIARAVVVAALIPLGAFYLAPRVYNLTATPYRLDQAVVSANNYNPALTELVEHEQVTLSAFTALDKMEAALASVHATDAAVDAELTTLTGQITGDLQATLNLAGTNVTELVTSLDTLTAHVNSLQPPVDGATTALDGNTAAMDAILADARATADKVHSARLSAEESANDLSGK